MRGFPVILSPQKSRTIKKATRAKKPRAAVIGMAGNRRRVKTGSILYDGLDRYVVSVGPVKRHDGNLWVKLYNQDLPDGAHTWFKLEDCDQLAVLLDEHEPHPVVL